MSGEIAELSKAMTTLTVDALGPLNADEIDAVAGEAMNAAAILRFQHLS